MPLRPTMSPPSKSRARTVPGAASRPTSTTGARMSSSSRLLHLDLDPIAGCLDLDPDLDLDIYLDLDPVAACMDLPAPPLS